MALNIGEFARRRALLNGDRTGLITGDGPLSFRAFDKLIDRVAALLRQRGIGPGDRVAVLLRNGVEFCALYYAAARLGAILCNLNWRLAPAEVELILDDAEPRLMVFDPDFAETVDQVRLPKSLATTIALGAAWRDALAEAGDGAVGYSGGGRDPLLLVYTSGTTGRPKGAVLTHEQMFWVSTTMAATLDYRPGDVNLIPVPMFHVGGMSFATIFTHIGATAILPPAWDPETVLNLIEDKGINHFFAVAAMLQGLLDAPSLKKTDLSSIRWIMAGGAPVPPDLIRTFDGLGIPVVQTYGATETAGPATVVDLPNAVAKAGSAGLPFFHTDVIVDDGQGGCAAAGEVGEICIKGPHLTQEYWRNPSATSEAFDGGWYRSGDLGRLDDDGYLFIVDRLKDMIVSGGENIYPGEVEAALAGCPGVAEAAVIGVPDDKWGQIVCAVVVPLDGGAVTLEQVRAHCADKIASYKLPCLVRERTEPLPRNATGKLQKHLL